MVQPRYGFVFNRKASQVLPAVVTDMSSVYLVGVSDDAVAAILPLYQTVWFNSNDPILLAALGTGDLLDAIQLINAQLAVAQVAARVAIHRVPAGANDAATIQNILGKQANGTGIYGALGVGSAFGFTPRLILVAGGYTGRNITRAASSTVVSQAAKAGGNTGNGLLTLGSPAYGVTAIPGVYQVRCKTPAAGAGVFSVTDPNGQGLADANVGQAYASTAVRFTIAPGSKDFAAGDGFDVLVTVQLGVMNANPIVVSLPQVHNAIGAHSVIDGPNTNFQDSNDFRNTIADDHTIMVDFSVTPAARPVGTFVGGSACAVGVGIRTDFENDGIPSQSWANQAVYGITALETYDSFSLLDGATVGQEKLAAGINICELGNNGDPAAAAPSGYNLICAFTCATDSAWQFLNVTRLRDYIHLQAMAVWRQRIGVTNITVRGVQTVENDLIRILGLLKADEHIIDFRVGVDATLNTPATIEAGNLRIFFKAEEASPLLLITTDSYRYPDALTNLITQVAGETNSLIDTSLSSSAS